MRIDLQAPEPGSPDKPREHVLATRGELAALMGQSPATIGKWSSVEGMPSQAHGVYDVEVCVQWRLRQLESKLDQARKTKGETTTSRKRRDAAEASLKELELGRRQGELVELVEAHTFARELAQLVASHLGGLAPRMAKRIAAESSVQSIQVMITDDVDSLRTAIADAVLETYGRGELLEDPAAAAEA